MPGWSSSWSGPRRPMTAGRSPCSRFETVAGFLAFAEEPADVLILETGLGGRLDATNVLERPALTALTPISMDHQQYLGDSLTGIAAEKAAILKPGVAGVISRQVPSVASVIEARAEQVAAPLFRFGLNGRCGQRVTVSSMRARRGGGICRFPASPDRSRLRTPASPSPAWNGWRHSPSARRCWPRGFAKRAGRPGCSVSRQGR